MKTELKEDRFVESKMTKSSKYEEDDGDSCYSAALPSEDDYSSASSGYVSLNRDSPYKHDPDAFKLGSSDTPLTSTTSSVSDIESFLPAPPLSQEDDDNDSTAAKRSKKTKTKGIDDTTKKSSKKNEWRVISADDASTRSSGKSKKSRLTKKMSLKFDGSQSLSKLDFVNNDNGTPRQKKYAKNDEVLYVSSNGDNEKATILKVHLDDQLVPFYDIRLLSSGREKQTDNAHLAALPPPKRERKSIKSSTENKPQRRSSLGNMASVRSSKSVKPRMTYAENDKVVYVSSSGDSENATILKVHLDDQLVPFYDIRLHSSDREKQTDDAHLKPCRERRTRTSKATDKPKRHSSMGAMSSRAPKASTEYSFTPDQLTKKSEKVPQRQSSISFGSSLPDGFISPHQAGKRATAPRRNTSLSTSDPLNINLPNSVVSPRPIRSSTAPKRNKSLSASESNLPDGVSPQRKRSTVPRRHQSMAVQSSSNISPKQRASGNISPKRAANRRAGSGSALPRLDRLDLTSSPSSVKSSGSKRPKGIRRRSFDNSG
ncbi:unnamed protein product [Cylindrotheca closterium]|uniref:Uncharacterized protein n=1 Tax=Cylindrotheca closterium TaxID=2856 RepID=A0AAD2CPY3_9STRA|nr:unnamed protein product [Cylindrotheca closterium]